MAALQQSKDYLLPEPVVAKLNSCVNQLLDLYALADQVAQNFQRKTERSILIMFAFAAAAIAALEKYAHLSDSWYPLLVYFLLLGGGYAFYRWFLKREYQGGWLDVRALAETLRVQIFWSMAERGDCTADHYLRHFRGPLDWIRHAVRAAFLSAGGHCCQDPSTDVTRQAERLRAVRTYWVLDQLKFFNQKRVEHFRAEIAFETVARLAIGAAILTAFVELLLKWNSDHPTGHPTHLVVVTFLCLVVATLCEKYSEVHTYALTARKYEWMTELFRDADSKLRTLLQLEENGDIKGQPTQADLDEASEVLFELGREALAENADWVIQHRHRPPTLPSG